MFKKHRILLSLVLVFCLISPSVFGTTEDLRDVTVDYYKSQSSISSFWEVAALYGAGADLSAWTYDDLNTGEPNEGSNPTSYANYILAELALGNDPRIGERDFVNELSEQQDSTTGSFSGMINQHIWAMITLDAAKASYDSEKALQHLASLKKDDGGYNYYEEEMQSDTDLTAMVLIALSNHIGDNIADELIADGVKFLKSAQLSSGGFASFGAENPNTIATVISGLVSVGENVLADDWIKEGSMVDALLAYRLDDGSYRFDKQETDAMATAQALIALDDIINGKSVWSTFNTVTVNIRIEGIYSNVLHENVTVTKVAPKAVDAIKKILNEKSIPYEIIETKYGPYLSSVNDEKESAFGGYDGWMFAVNGKPASVGIGSYEIQEGEEIVIYYGGFETYSISPKELRAGSSIKITVSRGETKIEGATVKVGKNTYLTDKNGVATIDDIDTAGTYKVNISKEPDDSFPAIVRIPEFEIKVLKEISNNTAPSHRTPSKTIILPVQEEEEPAAEAVSPIKPYIDNNDISDWAAENVGKAKEYNIMTGNDEGAFEPQRNITRAEFTAMLVRLLNAKSEESQVKYNDITENDWYYSYIQTANSMGFINGYDDNTFRPNDELTREEMAVIISRAFKLKEGNTEFNDEEQISSWAKTAVMQVSASGIIVGSYGNFTPKDNVTREMAAVVAVRLYENK